MKQVTGKELARALLRKGWVLARVRGSHHIFMKEGRRERIVVPIHRSQTLKTGLLHSIMKIADLDEHEL